MGFEVKGIGFKFRFFLLSCVILGKWLVFLGVDCFIYNIYVVSLLLNIKCGNCCSVSF